jgi:hypothetical protein
MVARVSKRSARAAWGLGVLAAWMGTAALGGCSEEEGSVLAPECTGPQCPGGQDGFDPGVDPAAEQCPGAHVTFEKRIPYVVLLVDQSGSMTEDFGNGTRWSVLHEALLDAQTGIVSRLENEVRFGLALYTSHEGNKGGQCPLLAQVSPEFGTYSEIKAIYDAAKPDEDTPTGESLLAIAEQLQKIYLNVPTPKVIVLATDGEPDTCEEPNPQNGQQESISAAQQAYEMGIETYVISVGDEVGLPHLQDMANAGLGLEVNGNHDAPFWQALDQDQLYDAFDTIINGVRDCLFTLDGNVVDGFQDQGKVTLDGQPLTQDDPDGWKLNGSNEVQLLGAACEAIQDGQHDLQIEFPCGGYTPPQVK